MPVRVAVNGFGRIGRNFLRALLERQHKEGTDVELVAVNDIVPLAANAHLLQYDSTHGRLAETVEISDKGLRVEGHEIVVTSETDPKSLPWGELGIDVVVDSTGRFTSRSAAMAHVEAGARRVVISAPAKDADATFVVGVNDSEFDPASHVVVSNASCTTNCLVPMVKVVEDAFGLRQGLMTTVHAYTNDQELLDLGRDNLRRARAAAVNIVPSSTGAARATSLVLAEMAGRLDGTALRVPVVDGSITDLTAVVGRSVSVDEVNAAFKEASERGPLAPVLEYNEAPIVSSDIVGSPASCTFDATLTMAIPIDDASTLVKVMGWYDNEWGYSHRLVDLAGIVGRA
ncbi:MAG TPA: type I glyceraldehyde-3-phosphate dehydrogenase [Acidimicrobiales bacterium]|nr:type I glyceraldehyde-3-phosphate dehydrogenase [Acidimicrobiales bacterium]